MNILVLTKRQYTNKDLIDDKYGRLFELPLELSKLGNNVKGVCLSYRPREEGDFRFSNNGSFVEWTSINLTKNPLAGFKKYFSKLREITRTFKPDVIWVSSDALHVIIGAYLQKKYPVTCVADLYDNYESFKATLPGIRYLYRRALREMKGLTCVTEGLRLLVKNIYGVQKPCELLENGIRNNQFSPLDKKECRVKLNIPGDVAIIGTAGTLFPNRGIEFLLRAHSTLLEKNPSVYLLLAGPIDKKIKISTYPNVRYLGVLPYDQVPVVYNAMDVAIICNQASDFGEYCFPQKFYEILACKVPVVAAKVGGLKNVLADFPDILYEPSDCASLLHAMEYQLLNKVVPDIPNVTWEALADKLNCFLKNVVSNKD